jgi:small neutral amino acid transporter SnatA (MarC family)
MVHDAGEIRRLMVDRAAQRSAPGTTSDRDGALLGVIAIAISIYFAYRFANTLGRRLGDSGLEVLVRLAAFILMCIGIEMVWNGYSALTGVH